jgi:hypothetical protein
MSARMLVAQRNLPVNLRENDAARTVKAALSVFRMTPDGKLYVLRTYDFDVGNSISWWNGHGGAVRHTFTPKGSCGPPDTR